MDHNFLEQQVNREEKRDLIVLGHEIDDMGGTAGSYEHVMKDVREVSNVARLGISERGVLPWTMPKNPGDPNAKYLAEITDYTKESAPRMKEAAMEALRDGKMILSLGGNHLRATELIGMLEACHELGFTPAILWADAHPDSNTPETTGTGNMHGTVASLAMGHGAAQLLELLNACPFLDPRNIVFYGVNAPDRPEIKLLRDKKVKIIPTQELRLGDKKLTAVTDALQEIQDRLGENARWWTELDADVFDDRESEGKVMPNRHGLMMSDLHPVLTWMGKNLKNLGIGASEVAPKKDADGKMARLIMECVTALSGVPNTPYAGHSPRPRTSGSTIKNRVLDWAGGIAAGILGLVAAQEVSKTKAPEAAKNPAPYVTPSERGNDRQFAFTGISSTNRFYPPNERGADNYSVVTFQQALSDYQASLQGKPAISPNPKRRLLSILLLAEKKGNAVPMWQQLQQALGESYWDLVDVYKNFSKTVDGDEIERYL